MSDIDPDKVNFQFEPPYPALPAEKIARIEQRITEEVVRPLVRSKYTDE